MQLGSATTGAGYGYGFSRKLAEPTETLESKGRRIEGGIRQGVERILVPSWLVLYSSGTQINALYVALGLCLVHLLQEAIEPKLQECRVKRGSPRQLTYSRADD